EPADHRRAAVDRWGLSSQGEEGRLEGVLGLVLVTEQAAADAPDCPAMPPGQQLEGIGVAPGYEVLQQLGVGGGAGLRPRGGPAQAAEQLLNGSAGHGQVLVVSPLL